MRLDHSTPRTEGIWSRVDGVMCRGRDGNVQYVEKTWCIAVSERAISADTLDQPARGCQVYRGLDKTPTKTEMEEVREDVAALDRRG